MKYLIIGGVAGGATTAARLRRMDENAEIILFEKGNAISYANCGLPYYIGNVIANRDELLLQTPVSFANRFNVEVRINTEVIAINPEKHTITVVCLKSGKQYEESYDKLTLSPGAIPIKPNMKGIDLPNVFTLRSINDSDKIKESVLRQMTNGQPLQAVIIGGGFIGVEMAENLSLLGMEIVMVEQTAQILAPIDYPLAVMAMRHLQSHQVRLWLNSSVAKIEPATSGMTVTLAAGEKLSAHIVIICAGLRPDSALAKTGGLKLGENGAIWVNEYLQTSDPDIYAIGDAIEFPHPLTGKSHCCYLAGPTNKQARICADNIAVNACRKYRGAIGTAIAKIFNLTAGCTGLSAKHLEKLDIPYLTLIIHAASHAGYYPEAKPLTVKLNFAPKTGKLLGAQVIGINGVDKRLDMLAATISHNGTIHDLIDIEHAYAPPYSSAKDPITVAGYVAENVLTQKINLIQWDELQAILQNETQKNNLFLIDVRSVMEYRTGAIDNAVNYPVDEIREFLDDIPTDKKIVIYCAVGLRGYVASRILLQSGFTQVYNLSGGISTYMQATTPL